MNRAEVLAAFNRQVRQGTAPDGTGATFETDAQVVRRLAVVSVAHPLRMRANMLTDVVRGGTGMGKTLGVQVPVLPERRLVRDDALQVARMLRAWSGPGWLTITTMSSGSRPSTTVTPSWLRFSR